MLRLLITIMVLLLPHHLYAFEVTFKKNVNVDNAIVTLGDVATIDTVDETGKALLTIAVANSPAPGDKAYLRSVKIQKYLQSSQTLPEDIDWKGSSVVEVKRNGITIDSKRILDLIADYLRSQQNSLPLAVIRFIPTSHPLPFILPMGQLTCDVIPSNPGILSSSRFSLIFKVDERVVKNMSIRGKVEARANIVTTAIPVKKGTVLSVRHLEETVMDIADIQDPGFSVEEFLGKKLKRSLRAGSPVKVSMVEILPVVYRGEKVKLVIQAGPMLLTATGLAHSDGKINDLIRVQNINSSKVVFGRVTGPGTVEVLL